METQVEMPRYKCHKEIWALKIKKVLVEDGVITLFPVDDRYAAFQVDSAYYDKHKPTAGGYYVAYKDGYKSFSPADAFEDGYTLIS